MVNVSEFLRELVVVLPGTVYAHASVLLPHLSSRPHQIRHAVVVALAEVVAAAHEDRTAAAAASSSSEDGEGGRAADGAAGAAAAGEDESQVCDVKLLYLSYWLEVLSFLPASSVLCFVCVCLVYPCIYARVLSVSKSAACTYMHPSGFRRCFPALCCRLPQWCCVARRDASVCAVNV